MVSDPKGGSGLRVVHRGKRLGGESGGLGMSVRGQGAWLFIRDGGLDWELIRVGRGSEVRVEGWA